MKIKSVLSGLFGVMLIAATITLFVNADDAQKASSRNQVVVYDSEYMTGNGGNDGITGGDTETFSLEGIDGDPDLLWHVETSGDNDTTVATLLGSNFAPSQNLWKTISTLNLTTTTDDDNFTVTATPYRHYRLQLQAHDTTTAYVAVKVMYPN